MSNWLSEEAAQRWSTFPVAASPRPVVLIDTKVRVEGRFADDAAKICWAAGAIEIDVALPPGVPAQLPPPRHGMAAAALTVTACTSVRASFLCDRGPRELPAYRLRVTGLHGSCLVLAPEVRCWWCLGPQAQSSGTAKVETDGLRIHFPATGGARTRFHRAQFQEHTNYVVGRAVTSERRFRLGRMDPLVLTARRVTGRLAAPLGDRVLVAVSGQPVAVTRGGRNDR